MQREQIDENPSIKTKLSNYITDNTHQILKTKLKFYNPHYEYKQGFVNGMIDEAYSIGLTFLKTYNGNTHLLPSAREWQGAADAVTFAYKNLPTSQIIIPKERLVKWMHEYNADDRRKSITDGRGYLKTQMNYYSRSGGIYIFAPFVRQQFLDRELVLLQGNKQYQFGQFIGAMVNGVAMNSVLKFARYNAGFPMIRTSITLMLMTNYFATARTMSHYVQQYGGTFYRFENEYPTLTQSVDIHEK